MAITESNNDWMITFYYEQDLRSYYMNGVLNGGFHPGVYNANMFLYTKAPENLERSNETSGVFLHIKKGTTLIFSNNYIKNENNVYIRDLDNVGTVLIKAVALHDLDISLVSWTSSENPSPDVGGFLGNNRTEKHYVIAKLTYNPDDKLTNEIGSRINIFVVEGQNKENESIFKRPYDESLGNSDLTDQGIFAIPDGTPDFNGKEDEIDFINWLCLGIIQERQSSSNLTADISNLNDIIYNSTEKTSELNWGYSHINDNKYNKFSNYFDRDKKEWIKYQDYSSNFIGDKKECHILSGDQSWILNHVFTARGLPEYRYSLAYDYSGQCPDFILSYSGENNQLYLDLKKINTGNNIISKENNWENIHILSTKPINGDYSFKLDKTEENKIFKFRDNNKNNLNKSYLLCDLLFLNSGEIIFNNPVNPFIKNDIDNDINLENILFEDLFRENKSMLWGKRLFITIDNEKRPSYLNLNDGFFNYDSFKDHLINLRQDLLIKETTSINMDYISNDNDKKYFKSKFIRPLDLSLANFDRLTNIINNNNFMGKIISYLRENDEFPPNTTSLIPVCIAFREFTYANINVESNLNADEKSYGKAFVTTDLYSSQLSVNPANILSFFDLNCRISPVHTIDFRADNIYSVLPIIKD